MLVNVGRKRLDLVTNIGPVPKKGGGGTPLCCRLYRYVPCHRVGFWSRFGLKTGIQFAHFGLESGIVFEGATGAYERISIVSVPNEEERKRNIRIRNGFEDFFC